MSIALDLIRPSHPLSYAAGLQLQARLFERIVAARAAELGGGSGERFAGGVILLEHQPTITLGRETAAGELLAPAEGLKARGIEVVQTDRGGRVTVHAPGQWVLYAVLDLQQFQKSVTGHIRKLEEVAICAAAQLGVRAGRIDGVSGAWVVAPGQGQVGQVGPVGGVDEKLCAVGIAVRKWITWHGLCFNVAAEMPVYQHIVACGQRERGVTNLQRLTGRGGAEAVPELMRAAGDALLAQFARVFEVTWRAAE